MRTDHNTEDRKDQPSKDREPEISNAGRNSSTENIDRQEGDMNNGETGGNFKAHDSGDATKDASPDSPPY